MLGTLPKWLVVGLILFSTPSVQASSSSVSYSKGMVAFSDGEFEKALGLFKEAYKLDPKNPDHAYLLGLTYLKLNDFSKASKYFKELLDKNPDYSRAYFDYGLSLHRQKKYSEAFGWFESAEKGDPKNPLPIFYKALTTYNLGDQSKAALAFKEVVGRFPKSEQAGVAKQWVAKLEGGEAPEEAKPLEEVKKIKKWSLRAATSFFYDSNVTVDPDDEDLTGFQSNQDDIMGSAALDLKYLLYHTKEAKLFIEYSGYQSAYGSVHVDMNSFNYGRHRGGINFQYKISDRLQLRAPIYFNYVMLGSSRYLIGGGGETALDFAWKKNWLTAFTAKIKRDDFFATPTNLAQFRDALRPAFSVEQYYFFPKNRSRYLKAGYEGEFNFAEGNDWDYQAHRGFLSFNTPLLWKLNFLALGDMGFLRRFKNRDSVFSKKRSDKSYMAMGVLSREIIPHLTTALSYIFIQTNSNIQRFTYHRHIMGMTLSTRF